MKVHGCYTCEFTHDGQNASLTESLSLSVQIHPQNRTPTRMVASSLLGIRVCYESRTKIKGKTKGGHPWTVSSRVTTLNNVGIFSLYMLIISFQSLQ
jgi:hypothetical protein